MFAKISAFNVVVTDIKLIQFLLKFGYDDVITRLRQF